MFNRRDERDFIKYRVDELIQHLELLFGKREEPPIIFDDEKIEDKVTEKKKIVIDDRIECFKKFCA